MNVELALRYRATPLRPAVAALLPGASAEDWLARLAPWARGAGVSLVEVRIVIVSFPRSDAPYGALAMVGATASSASGKAMNLQALGAEYGVIGGRLFLPTHAALSVALTAEQLGERLGDDASIYVWHPAGGLIRAEQQQVMRACDLLVAAPASPSNWAVAIAGASLRNRLYSIEPAATKSAEWLLDQGRDGIGEAPVDLGSLPPSPNEPSTGAAGAAGAVGREIKSMAAKMAQWIARHAPQTASKPTWINSIADWAQHALQHQAQQLFNSRHRELLRLLHLLESDPDEGLRFAPPMGDGSHRGLAPPSGMLRPNEVNFRLRSQGGGPADYWEFGAEYHRRLQDRYRELARREIGLGRHRRAAYIYAELLGDWNSAAQTLRDGGHFREAAAVYLERLKRRDEAARCLEAGQLWAEAIALYESMEEWETIGDLYTKLEQPDDARASFRRAVEAKQKSHDMLSAARILEQRLDAPDEALEVLAATWPNEPFAMQCAVERFHLLGRINRHDAARGAVEELAQRWTTTLQTTDVLADIVKTYPDAGVRMLAIDRSRVVISARLEQSPASSTSQLMDQLARLAPDDRLLARDCQRFRAAEEQRRSVISNTLTRVRHRRGGQIDLCGQFSLPANRYGAFLRCGAGFLAAGSEGGLLRLVRGTLESAFQLAPPWQVALGGDDAPLLVAAPVDLRQTIVVQALGQQPVTGVRRFAPSNAIPQAWVAGGVPGINQRTCGAAYSSDGNLYSLQFDGNEHLELKISGASQQLLQTSRLRLERGDPFDGELHLPLPMCMNRRTVLAAVANRLFYFKPNTEPEVYGLRAEASMLVLLPSGMSPMATTKLFVAHAQGCTAISFDERGNFHQRHFADDLPDAKIALLGSNRVVVATAKMIEVYRIVEDGVEFEARLAMNLDSIVGVVPASDGGFAVLTELGSGYRYHV